MITTKLVITLAICCVFGNAVVKGFNKEEALDLIAETVAECKEEVGAKDSDVDEIVGKETSSTMEGKCLRSCVMKKFQMMDDNGKMVKAVALTHANELLEGLDEKKKIASEIIDKCSEIEVADDHCEAAEQYGKCLKEQAQAHNFTDDIVM